MVGATGGEKAHAVAASVGEWETWAAGWAYGAAGGAWGCAEEGAVSASSS